MNKGIALDYEAGKTQQGPAEQRYMERMDMAYLEKVIINGEFVPVDGSGLEGRIQSRIEKNGANSCVVLQVGVEQKSFTFAFPAGCAGGGGAGSGGEGSTPIELTRLEKIYQAALQDMGRNPTTIRRAVLEFIRSL